MPVDPDDIEAIVANVSAIYREGELALLRQVGDHLRRYPGAPTAFAEPRAEALASLRRAAGSIQAAMEADGSAALRDAIAAAWRLGTRAAVADLPARWFERSGIGQAADAARDLVPQQGAIEALATALVRDVGNRVENVLRDVLDAFRSAVAGATARMLAGGQDRRTATQAAWAALVNRGITGFTDRSGRRWRLHSYVEMAVRTASARAAIDGQADRLRTLDVDLVYISDHVQECPLCRPWEGRILRLDEGPTGRIEVLHAIEDRPVTVEVAGTVAGARAAGLWHPNCRHSMSAYLPGVTHVPAGRPDPEGYEARMRQRHIERKIRRWKEQEAAATTDEAREGAHRKVRAWQGEMRSHLDRHPYLKRLRYREQAGAGSTPPRGDTSDPVTQLGPDVQPTLDDDRSVSHPPLPHTKSPTDHPPRPQGFRGRNKEPRLVHTLPDLTLAPEHVRSELSQYLRQPLNVDQRRQHALYLYSGRRHRAINRALRGEIRMSRRLRETIRDVDRALRDNRLPVETRVTRVVGIDAFGLSNTAEMPQLNGTLFRDSAFLSTTLGAAPNVPLRGDSVLMDIRVPAGTPAAFLESVTKYPNQFELLLARGLDIWIDSVDYDQESERWVANAYVLERQ